MTGIDSRIVDLPVFLDARGCLSFIQNGTPIPFDIREVNWNCHPLNGSVVSSISSPERHQLIVLLHGSLDIELGQADPPQTFRLNRPNQAFLLTPSDIQRVSLQTDDAVIMILAGDIPS